MSYYERKLRAIRSALKEAEYPPQFKATSFPFHPFYNCYAYALGLKIRDLKYKIYQPGLISSPGGFDIFCGEDLIRGVENDLEFLNIKFSTCDGTPVLRDGVGHIAAYIGGRYSYDDIRRNFHFIRLNSNGNWSEKRNWDSKIYDLGKTFPDISKPNLELVKILTISK